MPLYVYECPSGNGHRFDQFVALEDRNALQPCPIHMELAKRVFGAGIQTPIVRELGYSLKPGDKGYYDFSSKDGRVAPWEQRKIEPFSMAEDFYKHPPEAVPPDTDTYI